MIIVFGAILPSIYATEFILFFRTPRTEAVVQALAEEEGNEYDSRPLLEVVLDYRAIGKDAFPIHLPYTLMTNPRIMETQLLPLSGKASVLTVMCNETGPWLTYQSDEHGFNNPAGLYHAGQLDIILIGDSFTHGFCVPREKTSPACSGQNGHEP